MFDRLDHGLEDRRTRDEIQGPGGGLGGLLEQLEEPRHHRRVAEQTRRDDLVGGHLGSRKPSLNRGPSRRAPGDRQQRERPRVRRNDPPHGIEDGGIAESQQGEGGDRGLPSVELPRPATQQRQCRALAGATQGPQHLRDASPGPQPLRRLDDLGPEAKAPHRHHSGDRGHHRGIALLEQALEKRLPGQRALGTQCIPERLHRCRLEKLVGLVGLVLRSRRCRVLACFIRGCLHPELGRDLRDLLVQRRLFVLVLVGLHHRCRRIVVLLLEASERRFEQILPTLPEDHAQRPEQLSGVTPEGPLDTQLEGRFCPDHQRVEVGLDPRLEVLDVRVGDFRIVEQSDPALVQRRDLLEMLLVQGSQKSSVHGPHARTSDFTSPCRRSGTRSSRSRGSR